MIFFSQYVLRSTPPIPPHPSDPHPNIMTKRVLNRSLTPTRQTLSLNIMFFIYIYGNLWDVCTRIDRRLTNNIIGRFLACIKVEVLGLFVFLSFAIETCRIEEIFVRHLPYHLPTGSRPHFLLLHVVKRPFFKGSILSPHVLQYMSICLDFSVCSYPNEL